MNLLFICKHNRFRSKVAEALFKKYNKKKNIFVKSAGIRLDFTRLYMAENVKKVLKEMGIKEIDEVSREVNDFDLRWADKIILVADNISLDIFPREKTGVWKIEDADENDLSGIKKIVKEIDEKVKKLVSELNK